MGVERVSEIVLSIALLMPVLIMCSSLRSAESLRRGGRLVKLKATAKVKIKAAAATLPPMKEDELSKQLKYQKHQIDAMVEHLVAIVRATHPPLGWPGLGPPLMGEGLMVKGPQVQGEATLGERASPLSWEPLPTPR